jgi:hypothetical protein
MRVSILLFLRTGTLVDATGFLQVEGFEKAIWRELAPAAPWKVAQGEKGLSGQALRQALIIWKQDRSRSVVS